VLLLSFDDGSGGAGEGVAGGGFRQLFEAVERIVDVLTGGIEGIRDAVRFVEQVTQAWSIHLAIRQQIAQLAALLGAGIV